MKNRPPCLDWREKLALRHEDLSPAEQQALDMHVSTCDACSTALADYDFFEARLDALPPPAIKPLPRLSPHFFERTAREHADHPEEAESVTPVPTPVTRRPMRKRNKVAGIAWRVLSIAAIICLLLSASAIFRVVYIARLAAHPSGDTLFNLNQHTDLVTDAAWSPDGQYIATSSFDHTVKVWSASTGNLVCTYTVSDDTVYALAWSPNSQFIASNGGNNTIRIWNALNCSPNTNHAVHTQAGSMAIAWSPNGKYIASGGWDNLAQIWDVSTGQTLFMMPFTDVVSSITWSPDGQYVAAGSWDRTVQIWNMKTQLMFRTYSDYSDPINAVAWSPKGNYLAIGSRSGTVEVRDIANNHVVCDYTQHNDAVNAVAWSPNGKYIASGSDDKTVRIWNPFGPDTPTLMIYTQHTDNVSSVAWSPDGKEIVSGSWDYTAKVWAVI